MGSYGAPIEERPDGPGEYLEGKNRISNTDNQLNTLAKNASLKRRLFVLTDILKTHFTGKYLPVYKQIHKLAMM